MPSDPVPVSDQIAARIDRLIRQGRATDAVSILETGLAVLERQEQEETDKLETLRTAIAVGLDDLAAGRFTTLRGDALEEHIHALTTASE